MANVSSSNGLEKYPKLRFKGFTEPWNAIRFGDIVDEYSDRTKEEDEDILLSAAIEGMFLNSELFDHQRGASNKGYKKVDMGTLVLSTQNLHLGNANVNLRFEHGMVSPAYKTYHIHDCSIGLIAEWVKSERAKRFFYDATTVGASVCRRNVEWDTLYDQPLYLPSEAEQERLAAFLTALSTRIKKQTELVEHLKKYKRGLLSAVFSRELFFSDGQWISKPFSEIAHLGKKRYTPSPNESKPCIELEHIEQLTGRLLGSVNSSEQNSQKSAFEKGDVLFGKLRPYLKKYALPDFEGVCSTEIWVFKPTECITSEFLYYLVQSEGFNNAANISSGTKMPRAEWSKVASTVFFLPNIEDQTKIVNLLMKIDKKINTESMLLEKLEQFKKASLQKLFI